MTLDTVTCEVEVGCVLLQNKPGKPTTPIGYWSSSFTSANRVHDTTQRECTDIVWAVLLLRPYLEGTRITIRTSHDSLKWILNMSYACGGLAQWRLRLSKFDFNVAHEAGVKYEGADPLLRLRTDGEKSTDLDDDLPVFNVENIQATNEKKPHVHACTE